LSVVVFTLSTLPLEFATAHHQRCHQEQRNSLDSGGYLMSDKEMDSAASLRQRQLALSRWDNEGGAGPRGPQGASVPAETPSEIPQLTNAELVQLRIRVIALENLVIALLAEASERQVGVAREMATYILPKPGFTPHPLTVQAAARMIDLVERAGHFRAATPS